MAHDITGLDLGSFCVKAAVMRVTLRKSEIITLDREYVELDENGHPKKNAVWEAAERLAARFKTDPNDTYYCALKGENVSIHSMDIPKSAKKRLEEVLKFELDDLTPMDMDSCVFDFIKDSISSGNISVTAALTQKKHVKELIKGLDEIKISPREIGVAALSYEILDPGDDWAESGNCLLIDMGHERTNICTIGSGIQTSRTVLRGGVDLTKAVMDFAGISFLEAEKIKCSGGLNGEYADVLKKALKPFVSEVDRTIKGHMTAGGDLVTKIFICGGASNLPGIKSYLSESLNLDVQGYSADLVHNTAKSGFDSPQSFVLAGALAQREFVLPSKRINLRQGEMAFKGDYEYLKKRVGQLALFFMLIILAWIFSSFFKYQAISDEQREKRVLLGKVTQELFGKPLFDHKEVKKKLKSIENEKIPVPTKDAFDILIELSKRIPKSIVHDIDNIDIKPKRISIRGVVDAELKETESKTSDKGDTGDEDLSPTDLIKKKLEEFDECFTGIRIGKVTAFGNRRKYQMDIESKCP